MNKKYKRKTRKYKRNTRKNKRNTRKYKRHFGGTDPLEVFEETTINDAINIIKIKKDLITDFINDEFIDNYENGQELFQFFIDHNNTTNKDEDIANHMRTNFNIVGNIKNLTFSFNQPNIERPSIRSFKIISDLKQTIKINTLNKTDIDKIELYNSDKSIKYIDIDKIELYNFYKSIKYTDLSNSHDVKSHIIKFMEMYKDIPSNADKQKLLNMEIYYKFIDFNQDINIPDFKINKGLFYQKGGDIDFKYYDKYSVFEKIFLLKYIYNLFEIYSSNYDNIHENDIISKNMIICEINFLFILLYKLYKSIALSDFTTLKKEDNIFNCFKYRFKQISGTCWYSSVLNCIILSPDITKLIFNKLDNGLNEYTKINNFKSFTELLKMFDEKVELKINKTSSNSTDTNTIDIIEKYEHIDRLKDMGELSDEIRLLITGIFILLKNEIKIQNEDGDITSILANYTKYHSPFFTDKSTITTKQGKITAGFFPNVPFNILFKNCFDLSCHDHYLLPEYDHYSNYIQKFKNGKDMTEKSYIDTFLSYFDNDPDIQIISYYDPINNIYNKDFLKIEGDLKKNEDDLKKMEDDLKNNIYSDIDSKNKIKSNLEKIIDKDKKNKEIMVNYIDDVTLVKSYNLENIINVINQKLEHKNYKLVSSVIEFDWINSGGHVINSGGHVICGFKCNGDLYEYDSINFLRKNDWFDVIKHKPDIIRNFSLVYCKSTV